MSQEHTEKKDKNIVSKHVIKVSHLIYNDRKDIPTPESNSNLKCILGKQMLDPTKFEFQVKYIWGPKTFGPKKILGPINFGSKT